MSSGHEFEGRVENEPSVVSALELTAILNELHEPDSWFGDPDDDFTTVSAVAEATGHGEEEIHRLLQRLRAEDSEIRLSKALRELEEPLHRVERPGHAPADPLHAYFRSKVTSSLSPLLDSLSKSHPSSKKPTKSTEVGKASQWASVLILAFFTMLFVAISVIAILQIPR